MRVVRLVRSTPSAVLTIVQLLSVLIYPFLGSAGTSRLVFSLIGLAVLVLAVLSVDSTPAFTWVAILLGAPSAACTIALIVTSNRALQGWTSGFEALFYLYASGSMIFYMMRDHVVTIDELWAAGAAFTLLAWAFANLFIVTQALWPGSFGGSGVAGADRTWFEMLFLSFTTLSSTGLSDVYPVLAHARSVVMIEQVAGLGYVAMVVSRLVALTVMRRSPGPTGDQPAGD